ncbi:flavohemoglobin expression-modulating QEGLA motif protein [Mesonia aquimarina]|uniref:flavohemoglobin expression-modulating QEGLA motif protein n=1 Tax=Mesonia aquimarina TaxID=1504967 RepID=UPI000EF61931|nr:tyrosine/phenylalanine carboxypeptidase domain-containing protein [Mesonia aquimarina]
MPTFSVLSKQLIKDLLVSLKKNNTVFCNFSDGGILYIEKGLPYLLIYRQKKDDGGISRMLQSQTSYLIVGTENFKLYQQLIYSIADHLSNKFKSYLVFEIYAGSSQSQSFFIKGPADKLPTTLKVLQKELNKMNPVYTGKFLEVEIVNTPYRQKENDKPLLKVEDAKKCGALVVGLEIPPVFRTEKGKLYPVFFRSFRDALIKVLQKAIYEYIRVQTSSGISSYSSLGKKNLKDKVFEIDRKLSNIERSYQFLWLVSPANINEIKTTFFKSNYENVLNYHYRLLPIDPDVLKRKLYNLRLEKIDDPTMSFLFHQKREELDQQISMLAERGTRNFFYNSIRLYKGVEKDLKNKAIKLLNEVSEDTSEFSAELINAKDFKYLAENEFNFFSTQDPSFKCKVHIRKDVNIMMVSQGALYIPQDYKMNENEAKALIQHEVGTHVLTYFNGKQQPLEQLSIGLAGYDSLQEGLAVMAEYLVGGLTANRLRTLAGRVVAGSALMDGADFIQIFRLLCKDYGFSKERAFNITSRIMQGGGFLKDIIYLKGLVELKNHLEKGGEYEPLLAGKFSLEHTPIIKELTERRILKQNVIKPSFISYENFKNRLKLIRDGLPLSKMIAT